MSDAKNESSPSSSSSPPALFCAIGSETTVLSDQDVWNQIHAFLSSLGDRRDVLILPPDFTRFHSRAGKITRMVCEYYNFIPRGSYANNNNDNDNNSVVPPPHVEILPALGTHAPMTLEEIRQMYGDALAAKMDETFFVHDWRNDVVTIGEAPAAMVRAATHGMVDRPWPAQLNQKVWDKRTQVPDQPRSLVISIGQVVPHEVMGMANFNKNLFVGTGGVQAINLSHFIGAVHGMERMMGRKDNPLRDILNYASETFLESQLDLWYILTVVAPKEDGNLCIRGLYIGRDIQCYSAACDLSLKVNFTILDRPIDRCVVYLDAGEFHSTWLGNKAIYRTRMAMADNGKLIVLAPGVKRFGEDGKVDELIREFGYRGTPVTMQAMKESVELQENLSAVAHLIHGSSEGRFEITYCPGHLTKEEIEKVGFRYGDLDEYLKRYDVKSCKDGWNTDAEGEFFFISNPALGLWAVEARFEGST